MSQRVPRCNGHQDGFQCRHYWFVQANIRVLNADHFKEGERLRRCRLVSPTQNLDYHDLATTCTQYDPSLLKYDPSQEAYNPLTDEEITALETAHLAHTQRGTDEPFIAALALAEYKARAERDPADPYVVDIRSRAAAQSADLEARKQEGIEARKRNAAEAEERARQAAELAVKRAKDAEAAAAKAAEEPATKEHPSDG